RDGVAARQFDQIALDGPDAERLAFGCLRTLRRPEHLADVAERPGERRPARLRLGVGFVQRRPGGRGVPGPDAGVVLRTPPARALGVAGIPAPDASTVLFGRRAAHR